MNKLDFDSIFVPEEYLAGLSDYKVISGLGYNTVVMNLETGEMVESDGVLSPMKSQASKNEANDLEAFLGALQEKFGNKIVLI